MEADSNQFFFCAANLQVPSLTRPTPVDLQREIVPRWTWVTGTLLNTGYTGACCGEEGGGGRGGEEGRGERRIGGGRGGAKGVDEDEWM